MSDVSPWLLDQRLGGLVLALGEVLVVVQHARAEDVLAADATVELHPAHGRQVVAVEGEEQIEEQVLRGILGRRLARTHHAVDLHQRLELASWCCRCAGCARCTAPRSRSLTYSVGSVSMPALRKASSCSSVISSLAEASSSPVFGIDHVDRQDAADQVVVGHFQRGDVLGRQLAHVTRGDALARLHQHLAADRQVEGQGLAAQALGDQLQRGAALLAQVEHVVLEEDAQHLLVGVAQRTQQHRHRQLAAAVDAGEQRVLRIELEVQPGAAVGNHARGEQQLARAVRLAAVVVEEHARRTMQLRDDDALGAVDDEGAGLGHERDLAHVDLLLLDVLDRLLRGRAVLVVDDQAHGDAQRRTVGHAAVAALALVERRLAQAIVDVLQGGVARIAGNREHRLQRGVQTLFFTLLGSDVLLQELPVGIGLDGQQVGHVQYGRTLAEILADALLLGKRVGHGG